MLAELAVLAAFACQRPAGWEQAAQEPDRAVYVRSGRAPGYAPVISVEAHPGRDAEAYLRELQRPLRAGDPSFSAEKPAVIRLAGRAAWRLSSSQRRHFRSEEGSRAPMEAVIREDHVVVPAKGGFYALSVAAPAGDFAASRRDFETVLRSFRVP